MKSDFYKNLVILGPQGSGKGTQAHLLADKMGFVLVESGSTLREIAKTDTELGRKIKERIDRGVLVDSEIITETLREKISRIPADQPLIIEGYPRSLDQYNLMKSFWPELGRGDFKVLYINIPEEESVRRLSARRVCEKCGKNYIAGATEKCASCGGNLVQRHDDYPEAVKQRLSWSGSKMSPLVEELKKEDKLIIVDGRPSIEEVNKNIVEVIT